MNKKKLLALLMALVMTLSLMPVTAFAEGDNVAKIGTTEYETLQDAVVHASAGDTITMIRDASGVGNLGINVNIDLTLDLNGHTIVADSSDDLFASVGVSGVLTITDDTGNGVITTNYNNNGAFYVQGSVVLEGGTIINREGSPFGTMTSASVEINGGKVVTDNSVVVALFGAAGLTISNGEIEANKLWTKDPYGYMNTVSATITGGSFKGMDTTDTEIDENSVASGLKVVEDGGWYKVVLDVPNVAQIGSAEYATLAEAIAAVPANIETTITMIADEELAPNATLTVPATKNIVLDLNGKTVTGSSTVSNDNAYFITNRGTLEITDSTENANGKITFASDKNDYSNERVTIYNIGGTLTMTKGTVENTTPGGLAYAINNSSNAWSSDVVSTFNMTGGTVSAPKGDAALRVYQNTAIATVLSKNYVNISGGTILDSGIFVDTFLHTDGKDATNYEGANIDTAINITGGTVNGLIDMKIRHPYNTVMNISGGDFNNAKLRVRKWADEYAGNGLTAGTIPEPTEPMVNISDGKWSFDNSANAAFNISTAWTTTNSWTSYTKPYSVTGGVFNVDLTNYAGIKFADGQTGVENTDETTRGAYPYTVGVAAQPVAEVNGTTYTTLAEAIAAVPTDGTQTTIKLLQDIDLTTYVGFAKEKNVILDLNGKNIVSSGRGAIDPNGKLTIQDTSANADGKISATAWGIWTNAGAEVTIESGSVEAGDWAIVAQGTGAKVIVKGGRVYSENGNAISGIGNDGDKGYTITVNGGEVISDNSVAIYHPNVTTLTVAGGTVKGATAIYQKSGTLDITGGIITATGAKADYIHRNDGCTATGDAIVIENCDYPSGAPSATIKGATITSANGKQIGYYVYEDKAEGTVLADKRYTLSTNVPAKGWVENTDENTSTYSKTIGAPAAVAKVGDVEYGTLAAAIAAANVNGGTVTLLRNYDMEANEPGYGYTTTFYAYGEDTTRNNMIEIKQGVTLDLGGYTLSNLYNNTFNVTGDNVTFQNGTMLLGQLYYSKGTYSYGSYIVYVTGAQNFTVRNMTASGINVANGSTATMEGLTFRGYGFYAVCAQVNSTVTLSGGTYDKAEAGKADNLFWIEEGSTMNITGGDYKSAANKFLSGSVKPVITGGTFNFDPTSKGVADGYEAVEIEPGTKWQVGKIESTAIAKDTSFTNTNTEATYTASRSVVDENENPIGSSEEVTVTVTLSTPDSTVATNNKLPQYDQEKIVAKALEVSNADNLTVTIDVKHDEPEVDANNTITYEVHPEATITSGNQTVGTFIVTNDKLAANAVFTIKLPVPATVADVDEKVQVTHKRDGVTIEVFQLTVEGNNDNRYVTISGITSFSQFELAPISAGNYQGVAFTYSLDLRDSININFYVDLSQASDQTIDHYTVQYLYKGGAWQTATSEQVNGKYRYVVAKCAAKEMTEPVHVRVLYDDAIIKSADYTVKGYCDSTINASNDANLVELCKRVLDFGAAAQVRFNYNTDNLATATYYYDLEQDKISTAYTASAVKDGVSAISATVNLESRTGVVIYFTPTSEFTGCSVTRGGSSLTVGTDYTVEHLSNGNYMFVVNGISAHDLNQSVIIDFETEAGTSHIEYSPLVYAYNKQNNATVGNLCKALYRYWDATQSYFG